MKPQDLTAGLSWLSATEDSQEAAGGPSRLLLVDDEPKLLASLHALLDGRGFALTTASSGSAAIAELGRARFDLVLLDLGMPDMSGHDVMDFINAGRITTEVIVLSGHTGIDAAIGAINRQAYGYLRKPYRQDELLNLVRNALERRKLATENRSLFARLAHSEKMYRFLIDSSPDIIYTLDPEGRFTYINRRVTELLGFDRDALIGAPYTMLVHEDDIERARYVFNERRVGERASRNVELRLKCQDPAKDKRRFETSLRTISFNSIGLYDEGEPGAEYRGTYGIARDVTEKRRAEELITYQAYHDILTDLPNRALFHDRLELALAHARRKNQHLALMFIDLDRFKVINDSLGHLKGDELLRQVAARLKRGIRKGDTLARLGGDEFVVLLPELEEREFAAVVAEKFLAALNAPFLVDGAELHVSASIGIAVFPEDGDASNDLIRHADMAMYSVKADGKNGFGFYDRSVRDAAHDKVALEQELRRALQQDELEMYYQPQVDAGSGMVAAVEALMRWNHPRRGLLSAGEFLPLAEEMGLMVALSDWMVTAVCRDFARLRAEGHDALRMCINLSPTCLGREEFLRKLWRTMQERQIPPAQLELEITENICIRNPEVAIRQLNQLSSLGVRIAIDDFGTGYSSLAYLQRFAVDTLKIDQSFVREIGQQGSHFPVVLAVISIARGLGIDLVAEGVESEAQARYLQQAGCRIMQGYHFQPPLPLAKLQALLVSETAYAAEAKLA
ncbi:response regulator receiver modulated diguanylate cyclase/phosphodiesterase with PAS/PAC sensor(s) [Noviherbaspirillum humi]|uniref:Response regulator receiver modulated diguanylate cyclase/phosphodiesterase with PAS/PAC sensor(S) n=1 Tax=Noviherbaspirillum humi TaxID=1688639 RepID=A0A239M1W3_9BURK|nr:EAL domain-containing protein [Noviherbaspirillum humi]SNT36073.1 response regulator receiver modulated diguanylate cyclase/phosphodiesterase with PAS/PAC sensor(s) [Noviherbaspirillum humi]